MQNESEVGSDMLLVSDYFCTSNIHVNTIWSQTLVNLYNINFGFIVHAY